MAKRAKDEAKSWLWTGIMAVSAALALVGVDYLMPSEWISGDDATGYYAFVAFIFTVGCLCIVFRKKIAQWGTEETSFSERREKPKVAKDKSIGSIGKLLFTIGLLCLAGAYVFYKIVMSSPTMGFLGVFILLFAGVGAISTGVGGGLLILEYQRAQRQEGQKRYFTQKASSLLEATEILKKLDSIPQLVYYTVDTPDGSLGRDVQGFYTVGPLKTENLVVGSRVGKVETVECVSLRGFGDEMANIQTVAFLQSQGEYARLVLLMECGHCGYQSPVETEGGEFFRECYCCGTKNRCYRANINVFLGTQLVTI